MSDKASAGEASPLVARPAAFWGSRRGALAVAVGTVLAAQIGKGFVEDAMMNTAELIKTSRGLVEVPTELPGAGTTAYAAGKLSAVLFSSRFSGRTQLLGAMSAGVLANLVICAGTHVAVAAAWLVWRFCGAFVWGGAMIIVVRWVDHEHIGSAGGLLGLVWEGTHVLAGLTYAALLSDESDPERWRRPYWCASLLCLLCALLCLALRETPADAGHRPPRAPRGAAVSHPLDGATVAEALRSVLGQPRLVLLLLGSLFGFGTTYLVQLCPTFLQEALGATASQASLFTMLGGVGGLAGNGFAALAFDRVSGLSKAALVCGLAVGGALTAGVSLALFSAGALSPMGFSLLIMLVAFQVSPLLYVPQTMLAAELGGARHASTVTNVIDLFGIGVASLSSFFGGFLIGADAYGGFLGFLAVQAGLLGVFFCAFAAQSYREEKGAVEW